ncbi:MAG: aldose epimerase [Pseudomonadota bacterium]
MKRDTSLLPLMPGELLHIGNGQLDIDIAPAAGGRIARMVFEGKPWLAGYDSTNAAALNWGSYPMVPWAGRIRRGRFQFAGHDCVLPANLGVHAIHGVGFVLPWSVDARSAHAVDLSLQLPRDRRWPFGGVARQRLSITGNTLRMVLSLTAGLHAMPRPVLGWHPWFHAPERLEFTPTQCYPRDAEGVATLPLVAPPPRPWDDCFINTQPVVLHRAGQALRLSSDCDHWVIYDGRPDVIGVEPQGGPPDAFNLAPPPPLAPGETVAHWCLLEWMRD